MPFRHSKYKTSEITLTTWPSICEWRRHKKGCFWFQWRTLCSDDVTKPRKLDVEQASGTRLTGFPRVSNCVHLLNRNIKSTSGIHIHHGRVQLQHQLPLPRGHLHNLKWSHPSRLLRGGQLRSAEEKGLFKDLIIYFNSMSPHLKLQPEKLYRLRCRTQVKAS